MKQRKVVGNTRLDRMKCECSHSRGAHLCKEGEAPGKCVAGDCQCKQFKIKYDIPLPGAGVNYDDDVPF